MSNIRVFKFGGASVRNAESVRNMCDIIRNQQGNGVGLVVVVSAMGKTTNMLEQLYFNYRRREPYLDKLQEVKQYHLDLATNLGLAEDTFLSATYNIFLKLQSRLESITGQVSKDEGYDQIVSFGEILSTHIIHAYMISQSMPVFLAEAGQYIKTDNNWRDASIDWDFTTTLLKRDFPELLKNQLVLTQGFIGGTTENKLITLGREGSDFTAAVIASCLDAESVTIWKDVPGVLNADPKLIPDARLFDHLSYQDASEMTFYGASVIHPRTIKPLANKDIPLYVRSFLQPEQKGTVIDGSKQIHDTPTIIYKFNQVLVSFGVKDFTFVDERSLGLIFHTLAELNLKINLMQRSAITFSVSVDHRSDKLDTLIEMLQGHFSITFNDNLTLITVKNFTKELLQSLLKGHEVMLEQLTRHTVQVLYRDKGHSSEMDESRLLQHRLSMS